MDRNTLEIEVVENVKRAVADLKDLSKVVGDIGGSVDKVMVKFDKNGDIASKSLSAANKEGEKLYKTMIKLNANSSIKGASISVKSLSKSMGEMSKAKALGGLNLGSILSGAVKGSIELGKTFIKFSDSAVDATEQLNLFNTVFGNIEENGKTTFSELGLQAMQFQNQMHEAFSTNKMETMKMQASFQSLGSNLGIEGKYAEIMSEQMTKLTYDLASLYNKSEQQVAQAIQSGVYAGQTKPLRAFGADVTQNTLSPMLESLGINDRSISDLTQAEKEILRYLSVLKQTSVAQKDFAQTIESPSNQIKIFKQQMEELKQVVGTFGIGLLSQILPFVNGFIMAIKEALKAIATLFGITLKDVKSVSADDDLSETMEQIGTSAGDATKNVKELKRQLLGFDQINNLTTKSDSSSNVGGVGGIGAIDQRLLDAIGEYKNGMEGLESKATNIRNKILEWLGFTKQVNEETGEVTFKYEGVNKIDWTNMKTSLVELRNALEPFKEKVGEGLQFLYKEILQPLGKWTIEDVIPNFFSILATTLETLNTDIDIGKDNLNWIWNDFLKPIAGWTGDIITSALKKLKDRFKNLSDWAIENEDALQIISSFLGMFFMYGTPLGIVINALKKLADANKALSDWADKHPKITQFFTDFLDAFKNIMPLQRLINAIKTFVEALQKVADFFNSNGVSINERINEFKKVLSGEDTTNNFFKNVKKDVDNLSNSLGNLVTKAGKAGINSLSSIWPFKADGGIYKNGTWQPIAQYASGGLPNQGQMFIAREAGPELVGKIGSSTAVMNNNQIVSSVASGVAQAVASVMGNGSDAIEVYVHTDEGTVIDRINRVKRRTGVSPI